MSGDLYLKWTKKGRIPSHQGGKPIPKGRWTARVADPQLCAQGWHACRWQDAIHHISDELWIVRLDGTIIEGADKVVAERLKLVEQVTAIDDRTVRLFAADCAEPVLYLFERERPNDDRPRKAIEAARQFANGEISDAARDAAWDAAWAATWDAARDAAWDPTRAAARDAAWDPTRAAAWDPTRAAAWDAAWDAAWAATWAAAWDPARAAAWAAAWAAAGDPTRAAARAAAWDPARAAAWDAQTTNLLVNYARLDPTLFVGGIAVAPSESEVTG